MEYSLLNTSTHFFSPLFCLLGVKQAWLCSSKFLADFQDIFKVNTEVCYERLASDVDYTTIDILSCTPAPVAVMVVVGINSQFVNYLNEMEFGLLLGSLTLSLSGLVPTPGRPRLPGMAQICST